MKTLSSTTGPETAAEMEFHHRQVTLSRRPTPGRRLLYAISFESKTGRVILYALILAGVWLATMKTSASRDSGWHAVQPATTASRPASEVSLADSSGQH